jgi:predicted kinase
MNLIIVRGLPGSGKTTFVKSVFSGYLHYEADQYFETESGYQFDVNKLFQAHMTCQNNVDKALNTGKDCIVSNTFTTIKEMKPYLEMAEKYKANLIVVECSGQFGSVHNVPKEAMDKMLNRWQAYSPTISRGKS